MKRTVLASLVIAALALGGCAAKPNAAADGPGAGAGGPTSSLPAPVLTKNDCTDFKVSITPSGSDPAAYTGSGALPADAHPVSLLQCVMTNRDVPGQGQWQVLDTVRSSAPIDPFISTLRAAYAKPPQSRPKGSFACSAVGYAEPWIAAIDSDGRAYRIAIPMWGYCPAPDKDVLKALADLKTTVVSAERIRQIETPGAQAGGCPQQFAEMAFIAAQPGGSGGTRPFFANGSTADKLHVCYYELGSDPGKAKPGGDFEAAATITGAQSAAIYDGLMKAPIATGKHCDAPASEYAVVTDPRSGNGWSVVELDGCRLAASDSGPDREAPAPVIEALSAAKK